MYPYGTPQRADLSRGLTAKGYGRYDYGNGDMGDEKVYGDEVDEEKADMSLDYIDPHEGQYGDEYGDDHYDGRDREELLHEAPTQHFGLPPEGRVTRRHKTKKRVVLTAGNLVLDLKIPTRLESFLPVKGEPEMMKTRYTAITCDPDDFINEHFSLRQNAMGRETELAIVITMYNEDEELFCRTLYGVMKNIAHLQGRKNSSTWGPGSWKKIVVCIVSDGRKHINPRVLDCLASLGVYQEGAMKNSVQDKPVQAHMFEYTTSFALDPNLRFKYPDKGIAPTQIIFCLKEKNAKKINSHRWFFNAFAKTLDPKVCILLDVGTRPGPKAIYHLWKAFDKQSKVGGACGEIATYKGRNWRGLLNPLIASQCFEYKMSNILDKPTESVFGYCSVLPGAFSAYRWLALQNDKDGNGPLASYFMGETLAGKDADTFTANMYLAEDRILCWEIVAKSKCNYVLKFVKAAVAETDCPETIHEFISQRRRWLNGSFFAAVYALTHVAQVFKADHSVFRTALLLIESFYNLINLVFSWFAVANFYIFFVIVTSSLEDPSFGVPKISVLNTILQYVYLGTLVACFLFSMGNRPAGSKWKYSTAIYIFAILTIYMMVAAVLCAVRAVTNLDNVIFVRMIISVLSTYGVYVISSIIACDPFHLVTCFVQYILLQATYINVLNVYAFSNLHDLSWGTKGSDTVATDLGVVSGSGSQVEVELPADQKDVDAAYSDALDNLRIRKPLDKPMGLTASQIELRQKDYYANFRTNVLLLWSLTNGVLASVILSGGSASSSFDGTNSRTSVYMLCILIFVAATSAFRFLGSTMYLILRLFGA